MPVIHGSPTYALELLIVRQIVSLHEGTTRFSNMDSGTNCTITLSAHQEHWGILSTSL